MNSIKNIIKTLFNNYYLRIVTATTILFIVSYLSLSLDEEFIGLKKGTHEMVIDEINLTDTTYKIKRKK